MSSNGTQNTSHDTLMIRHLPKEFSSEDKTEFLQHFGAVDVKSLGSNVKNDLVFARFQSPSAAKAALHRLHQLEVLGNRLCVVFSTSTHVDTDGGAGAPKEIKDDSKPEEDKRQQLQDALMRKLLAWSSSLNLSVPPPIHIRYHYPPPTPATLANISRALAANPKLYTQLLHLMNRMNLPPPFQDTDHFGFKSTKSTQTEEAWRQRSSSESELESDSEIDLRDPSDVLPPKRVLPHKKTLPIKRPRFMKPVPSIPQESVNPSAPVMKPEEVFEKVEAPVAPKKIELCLSVIVPPEEKITNQVNNSNATEPETASVGSFGVMHPSTKLPDQEEKEKEKYNLREEALPKDDGSVITAELLASNRIPSRDLKTLPVFKNYNPGTPSCRLYIKNVSKLAEARDLHYIYRRYLPALQDSSSTNEQQMFDVRLMTEGRMKGQAFITLPKVELAEQALKETNGFILKDKPLVVQFARSAPAAAAPNTES